MIPKLNQLKKLEITLILTTVGTIIGLFLISSLFGTILTIICPLIFGYYLNTFLNQRLAINELSQLMVDLWFEAYKIEEKSIDKEFFEITQPINWGMYYNQIYFKKEVSFLYILGIYFNNLKWYNHELYSLPKEFKEKIRELSNISLEIDPQMAQHKIFLFEEFVYTLHVPYMYNKNNSIPPLIDFFKFLTRNCTSKYETKLKIILNYLESVK